MVTLVLNNFLNNEFEPQCPNNRVFYVWKIRQTYSTDTLT